MIGLRTARAALALYHRQKYRNKPTFVDGIRFASKKEAKRYGQLKVLEQAGEIATLKRQPRYDIVVGKTKIATYVGDFFYVEEVPGRLSTRMVVEDVKGYQTQEFKLKWALVQALYPEIDWRLS